MVGAAGDASYTAGKASRVTVADYRMAGWELFGDAITTLRLDPI